MQTEAAKRANAKYDKANTVQVMMKLNKKTDSDILDRLRNEANRQGYIKALIRADMGKEGNNERD